MDILPKKLRASRERSASRKKLRTGEQRPWIQNQSCQTLILSPSWYRHWVLQSRRILNWYHFLIFQNKCIELARTWITNRACSDSTDMELATCIGSQAIGTKTVHIYFRFQHMLRTGWNGTGDMRWFPGHRTWNIALTSGSRTCLELADMELVEPEDKKLINLIYGFFTSKS